MAKMVLDIYLLFLIIFIIYIIVKIDPIKLVKRFIPSYTFYYRASDLRVTKNNPNGAENTTNVTNGEDNFKKEIQDTKLYDSESFTNVSGYGFYNTFILKTENGTYDVENAQFYINENDSFNFIVSSFSKNKTPGLLSPGLYTYTITGGSGIFANKIGSVEFDVKQSGVRKVSVYI
jgi:hypothetical protein